MSSQDDDVVTVVARIDAYGGAELLVNGSPTRARLASIEDARSFVGQHALDLAARTGQEVFLDTSDPDGSWLFVARPDGSMVETTSDASAPTDPATSDGDAEPGDTTAGNQEGEASTPDAPAAAEVAPSPTAPSQAAPSQAAPTPTASTSPPQTSWPAPAAP